MWKSRTCENAKHACKSVHHTRPHQWLFPLRMRVSVTVFRAHACFSDCVSCACVFHWLWTNHSYMCCVYMCVECADMYMLVCVDVCIELFLAVAFIIYDNKNIGYSILLNKYSSRLGSGIGWSSREALSEDTTHLRPQTSWMKGSWSFNCCADVADTSTVYYCIVKNSTVWGSLSCVLVASYCLNFIWCVGVGIGKVDLSFKIHRRVRCFYCIFGCKCSTIKPLCNDRSCNIFFHGFIFPSSSC